MVTLAPEKAGRAKAPHGRYLQKLKIPNLMRRPKSPKSNACIVVEDTHPVGKSTAKFKGKV